MLKLVLGIMLSIGIVVGGVVVVDGLDLLRTDAMYDRQAACSEASSRPGGENLNCWGQFSEATHAADAKEKLLGGGIGVVLAGLGWLLAWVVVIKPRRRREAAAEGVL